MIAWMAALAIASDNLIKDQWIGPIAAKAGSEITLRATEEKYANPWDVQLTQTIAAPLDAGTEVELSFRAKSGNRHPLQTMIQQLGGAWTTLAQRRVTLTPEWQTCTLAGISPLAFKGGDWQVTFQYGFGKGEVQLADPVLRVVPKRNISRANPMDLVPPTRFENGLAEPWYVTGPDYLVTQKTPDGVLLKATPPPTSSPWTVNVGVPSQETIRPGEAVLIEVRARAKKPGRMGIMYELARPDHDKFVSQTVNVGPEWKTYRAAGRITQRFGPGETRLVLFLGYGASEIELSEVKVQNVGDTPLNQLGLTFDFYGGLQPRDDWRAPALARIEKIRKGDLTVRVTDARGKVIPGAQVRVEQLSHEFKFGTAVVAGLINGTGPDNERYRQVLKESFNAAVFENDMKWNDQPDFPGIDRAMNWLEANRFQVRGHNLVWGAERYLPSSFKASSPAQRRDIIRNRVNEIAGRYRGRLYAWDVVNEPVHETWLFEQAGWELFGDIHRWAREADPKTKLVLNEYNWTEENQTGPGELRRLMAFARDQIQKGTPIDAIGLQCHVGLPVTPISRVLEIFDEVGSLGKPIEITEYDLTCEDDAFHAAYTRDYLIAAFSHPKVESFLIWGFWANAHWRGEGAAMMLRDWTPRPAMKEWNRLIKQEWWTKTQGHTNGQGQVKFRAFYGRHRITVGNQSVEVDLKPGQPASVTLKR